MRPAKHRLIILISIVIFFALLPILFTRPLLSKASVATIGSPFDTMFSAWTLNWDLRMLSNNPFNLYNANIFYPNGHTLAYSDPQIVSAIISLPFMAATGNPLQSVNYVLILNFILCALGAYLLVFHLTRNRIAGIVSGIAYAYAPYKIAHLSHLQLTAAGWIPLAILCLHLFCEKKRAGYVFLFALFFLLQTLSSWHYGLILAVGIAVFLLVRLILDRGAFSLRWLSLLAAALLCSLLLILPFALPYFQVRKEQPGFERTMSEVEFYSADVQDFLLAPSESLVWGNITGGLRDDTLERGNPSERSLFPGLVPLVLGTTGIVCLFRRRRGNLEERFSLWYYLFLMVTSAILCLGTTLYFFGSRLKIPLPYRLLYYIVPGFKGIRAPARFDILVALSLAVFSGFAVKGVLDWLRSYRNRVIPVLASLLLIVLLVIDLMPVSLPLSEVPRKDEFPEVYHWLGDQEGETSVVEIPLAGYDPDPKNGIDEGAVIALESWRTYYSTLHWNSLLNGYSGYIPSTYIDAARLCTDFPSDSCIGYFRSLDIDLMILHGDQAGPEIVERMRSYDRDHDDVRLVERFDGDYVYELLRAVAID